MFDKIRADASHYDKGALTSSGFWATAIYRFGSFAHKTPIAPVKLGLLAAYKLAVLPWQVVKNLEIPAQTKIGKGLCLHHPFNVVIPPGVEIGDFCTIYHDVTLGRGPVPGLPKIGNNVRIFAGAKVLGGITVGDNVEIGANAVVIRDVEAGSIVSAPAARAIPRETAEKMRESKLPPVG